MNTRTCEVIVALELDLLHAASWNNEDLIYLRHVQLLFMYFFQDRRIVLLKPWSTCFFSYRCDSENWRTIWSRFNLQEWAIRQKHLRKLDMVHWTFTRSLMIGLLERHLNCFRCQNKGDMGEGGGKTRKPGIRDAHYIVYMMEIDPQRTLYPNWMKYIYLSTIMLMR